MCVAGSPAYSGAELERSVRLEGLAHRGRNIQKGFWGGGELLEVILRQGAEKWVEIPGWQGPPPWYIFRVHWGAFIATGCQPGNSSSSTPPV